MTNTVRRTGSICAGICAALITLQVQAEPLIINGGFEAGLFGWTTAAEAGSAPGGFMVTGAAETPLSGLPTVGPGTGSSYAVSDMLGAGARALLQSFTLSPVYTSIHLSFDLFVNNWADATIINPLGLTATDGANQHARVDILRLGFDAFDVSTAAVVRNFYLGADTGFPPNEYTHYDFDITDLVLLGTSFVLRFAEVDTESFMHAGVDNVSVVATAIPEPASILLVALGFMSLLTTLRRIVVTRDWPDRSPTQVWPGAPRTRPGALSP